MANFDWAPEELRALLSYQNGKLMISCSDVDCNALRSTAGKGAILNKIKAGNESSLLFCREHGGKSGKFTKEQIASWPENHKQCGMCRQVLQFESFGKHSSALFGLDVNCRECKKPKSRNDWLKRTREQNLLASAKYRAKKQDLEFDLELSDIVIPHTCPVLGIPISKNNGWYAPSIDRLNPTRGYTKDNIVIMSKRANALKSNMLLAEIDALHEWMHANMSDSWYHDYYMVQKNEDGTVIRAAFLDPYTYSESIDIQAETAQATVK